MTDPRQRTRAARPAAGFTMDGERDQVLARRRFALLALVVAVPITLILAIVTGSTVFLIANLVFDLMIAGYVALLLQIKQGQDGRGGFSAGSGVATRDVRVGR